MAINLTGEFDVVAEFSTPAINRVLAAMHRAERFLHTLSVHVDDTHHRPRHYDFSVLASVDRFGDPIVDHTKIGTPIPASGQLYASDPIFRALDPVVNPELTGASLGTVVPSNLKGQAQVQLSPPTIEVTDDSGNVTVRMQVMARYIPDANTSPLAEFIRGQFQITAPVSQVASQAANVIDIDLKVDNVKINFRPDWASTPSTLLSDADVAGINLLIRNALKTSFLPSNNPLPPNIHYLKFKTLPGDPDAIAALLNLGDVSGNPASMNYNSLGTEDDFAFAASRDFILAAFNPVIDSLLSQPLDPVVFDVPTSPWTKVTVTYIISLNSVTPDLQNGKIVLTIQGHAHTARWWLPDFDFTVRQEFSLAVDGATADLVVGNVSLTTTSWLADLFKGKALDAIRTVRNAALAQRDADGLDAYGKVNRLLSADRNLGELLSSLLKPADQNGTQPQEDLKPALAYTSVEIQPSGIVLRGSLAVPDWPPAHVEFEPIPSTSMAPHHVPVHGGQDYSALKSWIPGGTIQQYEWGYLGQAQPFHTEKNMFVLIQSDLGNLGDSVMARGLPAGYTPLCLTVQGVRLSASGPVAEQVVRATACLINTFPILNGLTVPLKGKVPVVTLTQPGPSGLVQVVGHASAGLNDAGGDTPNLIVHFADEQTADHLDFLTHALRESGREEDAPTAILAVVRTHQLANARHTAGVIYAEEQGGAWEHAFGVTPARPPYTLILGRNREVLWQHEGELDSGTLAGALRRVLVKSGPVRLGMLRLNLRIDRPGPNFLIPLENDSGRQMTLRKFKGRRVELVFMSSSEPSIEMVRDRQERARKAGAQGPVVIAIADGVTPESAKQIAAEHRLSATMVADPYRNISLAYRVNIWPTWVFIDEFGLVRQIRYGRFVGEHLAHPSRAKGVAAR